jgi:hypothetical protein
VMHWMSPQTLVWPAWVQVQVWHKTLSYHLHVVLELQHHSKCEAVTFSEQVSPNCLWDIRHISNGLMFWGPAVFCYQSAYGEVAASDQYVTVSL